MRTDAANSDFPRGLIDESGRFESDQPVNALSVDVEDYFQVSAFADNIAREDWSSVTPRVADNLERIIALFDRHDVKATFFTLGWVAERFPALIRRLVERGHEVASHGFEHTRVTLQNPAQFRADVTRTKAMLEDITGQAVAGYRAASYSITSENLWALDILQETGHSYSSSIYPIRHDLYGIPDAPRFAFRFQPGGILEIPVTTVEAMGFRMPCGGGGFFRLFPFELSCWAVRRVNKRDHQSAIFYFHPWEIDASQPRVQGAALKSRVRHYINLSRMYGRLDRLLGRFAWDRMDRVFQLDTPR